MGATGTTNTINTRNIFSNISTLDNLRKAYSDEVDKLSSEQYESQRSFSEEIDNLDTAYYRNKTIDKDTYTAVKQNLQSDRQNAIDYYNNLINKANQDYKVMRDKLENI